MTSAYEQGSIPPIEIKHRLLIAREYAGLDQDQLAERSGISRSTISNAENGHGTPRRATINAWALACGVPASWIQTGAGSPPPPPGGGGAPAAPIPADQSLLRGSNSGHPAYMVAGLPAETPTLPAAA